MTPPAASLRPLPDLTPGELGAWLEAQGYKAFHALRLLRGVYEARGEKARARVRMPAGLEARFARPLVPDRHQGG